MNTQEIQTRVNRLVETFGSGLAFRTDYYKLLNQEGLRASDVTREVLDRASKNEKDGLADKYRKPKKPLDEEIPLATMSATDENICTRRKVMNLTESEARALLVSQGRKRAADPSEFPTDRLAKKLNEKDAEGVWVLAHDPKDPGEPRLLYLLRSVGDAINEGEEIVVIADLPNNVSGIPTEEETTTELPDSEEQPEGESVMATATAPEPVKRKRGRPKKNPEPETTNRIAGHEGDPTNGRAVPQVKSTAKIKQPEISIQENDVPKWKIATQNLAKQFRDMQRYPHDREIQPKRCEFLRAAIKSGLFHGAEWVSAHCKETGETYRVNGKHTSNVLCELYEAEEEFPEVRVWVREFNCETLADVAQLFASYDPKESARSKNDILRSFAVTENVTADLSPRWLSLLTSGLAYAEWEQSYNKLSPKEQSLWLLQNKKFVPFAVSLFESDPKGTKHIQRMPVVAAMFKTWKTDSEAAADFWSRVGDDSNEEKGSVVRTLAQWLLKHKIGAVKATSESVSAREAYCRCILAWNAWREKEDQTARFAEGMETPAAV